MISQATLVTGANGFLGYEVVRRLAAEGRTVVAVDRSIAEVSALTDRAFELEIGDVHRLHAIADRHHIDAIVHCGGFSGPMVGRDNAALMFKVNVGGTLDVAELARQTALRSGRCRVVFCSSLTVYGDQPADDITEDFPLRPGQSYPSSKIAGEAILSAYAEEHGVDAIALRIAGVYGPRRKTSCVLRRMITDALQGRSTHLPYGMGFPRQWVHVDDVVAGILLALDVEAPTSRTFNISAGVNPTIDEAAAIIRELIPSADITLDEGADPEDVTLGRLSIAAAERELGYRPAVPLRQGIEGLVEAIKEQHRIEGPVAP